VKDANHAPNSENSDAATTTSSNAEKKEPPLSAFESVVRSVTGRSDHIFGDLSKGAFKDVAKATCLVDDDGDDYHFGVSCQSRSVNDVESDILYFCALTTSLTFST